MAEKAEGGPKRKKVDAQSLTFNSIDDLRDPDKGPEIDRRLKAFALSLTKRDTQRASDLVSLTYEKAISAHARGLFQEGTQFLSWLYRIAQNAWFDQVRAEKAKRFVERPFGEDESTRHDKGELGVTEADQERVASSRRSLQLVKDAIETLPPEQQELIILVSEGVSYKDMAEIQGVEIGTVMSRLSRARAKLRALTGYGGEDGE